MHSDRYSSQRQCRRINKIQYGHDTTGILWKLQKTLETAILKETHHFMQSPNNDYVTRCYFNLCLQQGSRDDIVSRDVFSFLYV